MATICNRLSTTLAEMPFSLDRKIHPLDERDLAAVVLYHVVSMQAVAASVEFIVSLETAITFDRQNRLANRFGFGALGVVHRYRQYVQRIVRPAGEVVRRDAEALAIAFGE